MSKPKSRDCGTHIFHIILCFFVVIVRHTCLINYKQCQLFFEAECNSLDNILSTQISLFVSLFIERIFKTRVKKPFCLFFGYVNSCYVYSCVVKTNHDSRIGTVRLTKKLHTWRFLDHFDYINIIRTNYSDYNSITNTITMYTYLT